MARRIDKRRFKDREAYTKALKRQFAKSEQETRKEYESKVEVVRVPSRYGRIFRNTSIAMLAIFLGLLGFYFGRELFSDYKSREEVSKLQEFVSSVDEEVGALTTAAATPGKTAGEEEAESLFAEPQTETEEIFSGDADDETEEIPEERLNRYWELYRENNDFCGWLTIEDTVIDYPVMHVADDNDFYLSHGFSGEEDVNGLLVLDKRCRTDGNENHLLIHGHNMRSGYMFGTLKEYKDPEYLSLHPYVRYDSLFGRRTYKIFAVFQSSVNLSDQEDFHYYDYIDIDSREAFEAFVAESKRQSLYPIDAEVSYGDHLLTLSTCDYQKDNGRLVIVAASHQ